MKPEAYVLLGLSAIAIVFIAIDWIGLWMERRGWVYWRKKRREGGGSAMAGALNGFQQIIEPQIEHRIQVMEERNESIGQRLGGCRDGDDDDHPARPGRFSDPISTPTAPSKSSTQHP
jgi:hypothetical protein